MFQRALSGSGGGGSTPSKGTVFVSGSGTTTVNLGFEPSVIELYITQGSRVYATIYDKKKNPNQYYNSHSQKNVTLPQTSSGAHYGMIGEVTSNGFTILGYESGYDYTYDYIAYP